MLLTFFLLFVGLNVSEGCTLAEIPPFTAYEGGSVLLPCYCTNQRTKPETFTWKKYDSITDIWEEISSESDQYRNRVQLFNDHSPGNLSLLISHLTEEDGGHYKCEVKDSGSTDIALTVKVCTLVNSEEQPSITAHTGGSVLLPCYCTDLRTKPKTFTWKKFDTNRDTVEEISSESDQYRNRVQLFNDHSPGNLSLLISHLTEEDGGDYRCHITADKQTDIRLTVEGSSTKSTSTAATSSIQTPTTSHSGASSSKSSGMHFFVFIPVLLLLLALGGVIYWRYRGQRQGQMRHGEQEGSQRKKETQDQVTYSTIVHDDKTSNHTAVKTEDKTEYATIKVN